MPVQYLLDEHLPFECRAAVLRRAPEVVIWRIGEPGAPAFGTLDPALLRWCEGNGFVLVTGNRSSIPRHLAEHLAEGRHVPGILTLRPGASLGAVVEDLLLIVGAAVEEDLRDQILYLPLE